MNISVFPELKMGFSIDRSYITQDFSLLQICEIPPIGWENIFQFAHPELVVIDNILSRLGPYFPLKQDLFRTFDLCPLSQVKVVILGQDPYQTTYNGSPQANGIAFSVGPNCPMQPSLQNIFKEICSEYPECKYPNHGDLSSWVRQGVLMLNTCLTVQPHVSGSHKDIWSGFITKILEAINRENPECIFMLWGKKAENIGSSLNQRAVRLIASHPSPMSAYRGGRDSPAFFGCGHFKTANEYLIKQGKEPINWQI